MIGRPVHHGAGVVLGVLVGGDGDLAELRGGRAVLVHVALHLHGEELGGRHQALGDVEGVLSAQASAATGLAEAAELALRERSVDHDEVGVAGDDAGGGVADGGADASASTAVDH